MIQCEICCGERIIRVPVYCEVATEPNIRTPLERPGYREYPCPECMDSSVPFERLGLIKNVQDGPSRLSKSENFLKSIRARAAQEIGMGMLERGYIRFEQSEPDSRGIFQMRATVGAVSPVHVAKLEERVRARQFEVAGAAIAEAISQVNNWGSEYRVSTVQKEQAAHLLRDALQIVRKRYG